MKEADHRGGGSTQLHAELPDDLPQFVRVFLYDPQKLLRVRKLAFGNFLTPIWAISCVHGQWFKGEPKDTIDLNQRRVRQLRRPYFPSSLTITVRASSWLASAVQLREILKSTEERRAEIFGSRPRILYSAACVLHCSIVGTPHSVVRP